MKISLILCTLGRSVEVFEFLDSLMHQTYTNYEVIVVDQNIDQRIASRLYEYSTKMTLIYLQSSPGLSQARNIGLSRASGDIVGFPDDDCTYPKELLNNIAVFFHKNHKIDILMGKTIEKNTGEIVAGKLIHTPKVMKCYSFGGSSTTLFVKVVKGRKAIFFDENFGIGAKFFSEEENDLVVRLLHAGWIGYYHPIIDFVYHPKKDTSQTIDFTRVTQRGYGLGGFIAKHFFSVCGSIYFLKYMLMRPYIQILLNLVKVDFRKISYFLYRDIGIYKGFKDYMVWKLFK